MQHDEGDQFFLHGRTGLHRRRPVGGAYFLRGPDERRQWFESRGSQWFVLQLDGEGFSENGDGCRNVPGADKAAGRSSVGPVGGIVVRGSPRPRGGGIRSW